MFIDIFRLLIDFGLVILIWLVQLVVYPSFLYYNTDNLVVWHRKYTSLIGYIVLPLMLLQLGITMYQITHATNLYTISSIVIVGLIWIATFTQIVPIHNTISKGTVSDRILFSLVKKNWTRTFLWTILFINSFLIMFSDI